MQRKPGGVVVITGGSAGVGRATAKAFAREGYNVGLIARGRDGLEGAKREVEDLGTQCRDYRADVASAAAIEDAADYFERELGPIDIWVNNAMTSVLAPVKETTAEEFRRVTEVTYLGYVHGTLAALHRMLPRDEGVIIQVGSALAYRSIPLQAAYCAAKHAILGFTESLRTELLHDKSGVHVKMAHLPAVNTPQFRWVRSKLPNKAQPLAPVFQPEVPAEAITWLAHSKRDELYVGWPAVKAIWGGQIAPRWLDHYLARNAYQSQQTDEPEDPGRADNLFEPVPGDHDTHGVFDERSRDFSWQLGVTTHRKLLTGVMGGAAAVAAGVMAVTRAGNGRENR
ncbi:MAG: SDR family oxidoreductase [Dehalococcoidia bacterium]|nr:SDR family oxidoreductase [Dehalococcoidia bacterium]